MYAPQSTSQISDVHGSRSEVRGQQRWCSELLTPLKTSFRKGSVMNLFRNNRALTAAAFATLTAMGALLAQSSSPAHAQQADPTLGTRCGRRQIDSPLPRRYFARGAWSISAAASWPTQWPEKGDRHRCIPGRTARNHAETGPLLGDRLRLAQGRGQTQRPAAIHHHHRRPGHSFHPRPLQASQRGWPINRHPRLAGIDHRADEDHRPAHRSHRLWWARGGCLRRGDSVDTWLRLFRQADHDRLGPPTTSLAPGRC